ncbi:MAG: alpha/beta hydrolase [Steroidobacteraceae bacterium]
MVLEPDAGGADASVVWLHGLGADGHDFVPIVAELGLAGRLAPRFVFPHAAPRAVTLNGGARMRAWFDVFGFAAGAPEDEDGIRRSVARVERLIRAERSSGPAERRIIVAGFSQGGAIALHAAGRHAESLAGVFALSTWLPLRTQLPEAGPAARSLPILMCHGLQDPVVPLEGAERSRDTLRERGYQVEWQTYPMQHQVCPEEIAAIARWLAARLT